jgi:hypothetical protein
MYYVQKIKKDKTWKFVKEFPGFSQAFEFAKMKSKINGVYRVCKYESEHGYIIEYANEKTGC